VIRSAGLEGSREQTKTVLVTGGSGFLGSWCLIELLRRGHRVRTTVRDLGREPEVRAVVSSQVEPGDRLTVLAADLRSDDGWAEAAAGCDFVLHVASPFPSAQPKDPDELIVPAREGTLRVLGASLDAGASRVVVTSSVAAITGGPRPAGETLTEPTRGLRRTRNRRRSPSAPPGTSSASGTRWRGWRWSTPAPSSARR
jgi:nucleoside-diphosphate-sugar epimerase